MAADYSIRVLGGLSIADSNGKLMELASRKAEAIVVYMLFSEKASCEREELATLFWEDMSETNALSNLRVTLANIKKQCHDLLLISHRHVAINPQVNIDTDGLILEHTISEATGKSFKKKELSLERAMLISERLTLYRGDFLQGFFIRNTIAFEDWASFKRESLRREVIDACLVVIQTFHTNRLLEEGITIAYLLLLIDPYNDMAYYSLMELYALNGQREKSMEIFEKYKQQMGGDLGVESSEDILTLIERIREGSLLSERSEGLKIERTSLPVPNNIPVEVSTFFGRETELSQLHGYLHNPHIRLVTLIGQGGTGKTRLAVESARQNLREFPDGVWFVPLESVVSADLVLPEIFKVLGLTYPQRDQALVQLVEFLNGHHILLVLDNFEHVLDASPLISDVLQHTENSKIMITSREMTGLVEETNIYIEGLEGETERLRGADGNPQKYSPAVEMFIDRTRRHDPDFEPGKEDRQLIKEIIDLVARLPLGVELSASGLRRYTLAELREHIARDISFLKSDQPDLPARQRSLMSVFNTFWEQLAEDERLLICRLSTFCGMVTQDAARQVAGVSIFFLSSLVSRGFLKRVGPYGYRAHSMHRQYVRAKFKEIPKEFIAASEKHRDYYFDLLRRIGRSLRDSPQKRILDEMEEEMCNFRSALNFTISQGQKQKALALCELLMPFWKIRGYFQEGYHWMDQVFSMEGSANQVMESSALCAAAKLVSSLGDNETAEKYSLKSLQIARGMGDQHGIARALNSMGATLEARGNGKKAEEIYNESLKIYRELRVQQAIAGTLVNLANLEAEKGHLDIASDMLNESLKSFRLVGDSVGVIHVLHATARVALIRDDGSRAVSQLKIALEMALDLSAKEELTRTYLLLARAFAIDKKWVSCLKMAARAEQATLRYNLPLTEGEKKSLKKLINAARTILDKETFTKAWRDGENSGELEPIWDDVTSGKKWSDQIIGD